MARGIGTTRSGSPLLGLQTLIDRITKRKKLAAVRVGEVLDAANVLEQDPRTRMQRYRNSAVAGGVLKPVVHGVGRAAERMALAPKGQRLQAGVRGLVSANRGDLAKHITEGVVGGGAIRAAQEGLEIGQAKKKVRSFLNEPKTAEKPPSSGNLAAAAGAQLGALSHRHSTMATSAALGAALSGDPGTRGRRALGSGVGSVVGQELGSQLGRSRKAREARVALRALGLMGGAAAGNAAAQATKRAGKEKKPPQSRLPLKPISSPDLDFEV